MKLPERFLTEDFREKVDVYLEKVGGVREHAAVMAGISVPELNAVIRQNAALNAKWGKGEKEFPEPGIETDLNRKPGLPLPRNPVAAALAQQDAILAKGFKRMGLTDKEVDFLEGMKQQYSVNLRSTIDLAYSGAAHATTRLIFVFEDIMRHIADIDANPGRYERQAVTKDGNTYTIKGPEEFRNELYDRLTRVGDLLRKMNATTTEAVKVRAVIEKMAQDAKKKEGPQRVAGWAPSGPVTEATPVPANGS